MSAIWLKIGQHIPLPGIGLIFMIFFVTSKTQADKID